MLTNDLHGEGYAVTPTPKAKLRQKLISEKIWLSKVAKNGTGLVNQDVVQKLRIRISL